MATMHAKGCHKVMAFKTAVETDEKREGSRENRQSWVIYTLRSDGSIMRKIAFKSWYDAIEGARYVDKPYITYSSNPIVAKVKPESDKAAVFTRYCEKRGATVPVC